MKKILIFLMLIAFSNAASHNYGSIMISEVSSIYDGDTFTANIKEWTPLIGKKIKIRVNGIDTPEIRGKCQKEKALARKAKQFSVSMLREAKRIELRNMKRGKYFRIVADVYVDGKNLAKVLIKEGLGGVKYPSETNKNWCN